MPDVAVVTDTTHYLPRETRRRARRARGQPVRQRRASARSARPTCRLRRVLRRPAHRGRRCRRPRSPRSATSSPSTSRSCADGPRHRLDPHLGRHLGHGRGRAPGRGRAARAVRRAASRSSTRKPRAARWAWSCSPASPRRARRRRRRRGRRARPRGGRAPRSLWFAVDTLEYLRRGGRIGAAQAWLGGALKIKPILTFDGEITPIERVRTVGPRVRADGRLPARRATTTAPTAGSSSTSRRPTRASAWSPRGREIFGTRAAVRVGDRAGHRRPRRARACSASAACRWRCCE